MYGPIILTASQLLFFTVVAPMNVDFMIILEAEWFLLLEIEDKVTCCEHWSSSFASCTSASDNFLCLFAIFHVPICTCIFLSLSASKGANGHYLQRAQRARTKMLLILFPGIYSGITESQNSFYVYPIKIQMNSMS